MDPVQTMVDTLRRIRDTYGEDKFKYAAAHSVRMVLAQYPERKEEIREALKDIVNIDELLGSSTPKYPDMPTGDMMNAAIKQSMPGIQTQAQFDVTITAFDALRSVLNATFLADKEGMKVGADSLMKALKTAEEVTVLSVRLSQVPEAATSEAAERFKQPPIQFQESELASSLLAQMEATKSVNELNDWYTTNREDIDRVVTPIYRNGLLDRIRAKKQELRWPTL